MNIAHFDIPIWQQDYLKSKADISNNQVFFEENEISEEMLAKLQDIEILTIFIQTKITAEIISSLPKLRLIVTRSTGYDHIDIGACSAHEIKVCNVPTYGTETIAEHTFGLLLNICHNLNSLLNRTKESNFKYSDYLGFDLAGKTLGVIGAGKIGKSVIKIAKSFDLKVIAFDIYEDAKAAIDLGFSYVTKEELLAQSDIISLHCNLNDSTRDILSLNNFSLIKKGCILINTARGDLISNEDLFFGLENGIFAAAGLDTLEDENSMFDGIINETQKKLLALDSLFYTPHSAYYTKEAITRILDTTYNDILGYQNNHIINQVS